MIARIATIYLTQPPRCTLQLIEGSYKYCLQPSLIAQGAKATAKHTLQPPLDAKPAEQLDELPGPSPQQSTKDPGEEVKTPSRSFRDFASFLRL